MRKWTSCYWHPYKCIRRKRNITLEKNFHFFIVNIITIANKINITFMIVNTILQCCQILHRSIAKRTRYNHINQIDRFTVVGIKFRQFRRFDVSYLVSIRLLHSRRIASSHNTRERRTFFRDNVVKSDRLGEHNESVDLRKYHSWRTFVKLHQNRRIREETLFLSRVKIIYIRIT